MKALLVSIDFPPAIGGIQTMMSSLAARMTDWDLTVVAPALPGAAEFDRRQPYGVVRASGLGPRRAARFFLPGMMMRTAGFALTHRPDVLLCGHPVDGLVGLSLQRALRIPYLVTTHSMELRSPRLRPLLPHIFAGAARVLTNSRYTRGQVVAFGVPEERVCVLPLGFDSHRFDGAQPSDRPQKLGLAGRPWLLTVSRLDERYKGIDTMLRALPLIAAKVPEVRYVVAGDGPLRPYLERLAGRLGCRERVHFLGRVSDADLVALYQGCTAFVLMSRDRTVDGGAEGFGLVFLEANSFGKPVLGGNAGGIPDAVIDGETGLLADPESLISVAEQSVRLLTDRELADRLGRQGRERALGERTWAATADCLKRTVEDALRKVPHAAASDCVH